MARRVELIYGPSGSGKTTWLLTLSRYIWDTTGKVTRWYLGDGGGETIYNSGMVGKNVAGVFQFNTLDHPLETTQLICEGWWPNEKGVLVPPSKADLDQIGLFCYEGLTFIADYIMGDKEGGLSYRAARGELINKEETTQFNDGKLKFGSVAPSGFGFTQRRLLDLIQRTWSLPGIVYFTAHERLDDGKRGRGKDIFDSRDPIYGPDAAGKALTTRLGGSFGNTLHLQKVHKSVKALDEHKRPIIDPVTGKPAERVFIERRAYTRDHIDPEGRTFIKYFANVRVPKLVAETYPDFVPEYVLDPIDLYRKLQEAERLNEELAQVQAETARSQEPVLLF